MQGPVLRAFTIITMADAPVAPSELPTVSAGTWVTSQGPSAAALGGHRHCPHAQVPAYAKAQGGAGILSQAAWLRQLFL